MKQQSFLTPHKPRLTDAVVAVVPRRVEKESALERKIRCSSHLSFKNILLNLHWLPIYYRNVSIILLITYKALKNLAPSYIRDLLTPYVTSRQLRSSFKNLLVIPRNNLKTFGARSFSVAAPTPRNTLPSDITNSSSVSVFKNRLKTFLFKKTFFIILLFCCSC